MLKQIKRKLEDADKVCIKLKDFHWEDEVVGYIQQKENEIILDIAGSIYSFNDYEELLNYLKDETITEIGEHLVEYTVFKRSNFNYNLKPLTQEEINISDLKPYLTEDEREYVYNTVNNYVRDLGTWSETEEFLEYFLCEYIEDDYAKFVFNDLPVNISVLLGEINVKYSSYNLEEIALTYDNQLVFIYSDGEDKIYLIK